MSWHTSVIFIEQRHPSDFASLLDSLGFPGGVSADIVGFEDATSSLANGKSVAHVNGWTVVCDPMFFVSLDSLESDELPTQTGLWAPTLDVVLRQMSSSGGHVFGFVTEGASGTHGFTWYEDGELRRAYLWQEGKVVINDGEPLSHEADMDDEEQRILHLMEKLCVGFESLADAKFQVFEYEMR
ncbi:MAG: hypothetical protein HQ567_16350 [Candidatus Nealsonbacteria bacterium]|nr:hypothetical protein [Candidatus Nealsonbacteria bacterium]